MNQQTRSRVLGGGGLLLAALTLGLPTTAVAAGTATVAIKTPKGVPANVILEGSRRVIVSKAPGGTTRRAKVTLRGKRYKVKPQPVTDGGTLYAGRARPSSIKPAKGKRIAVRVTYMRVPSASSLRATRVERSQVTLSWAAPKGASFVLRRTVGRNPADRRRAGVAVAVKGRGAVDRGLVPGTTYSYALFTKVRRRWTGPVSLTVGTAPPEGSTSAAYIAAPTTVIPAASAVASATATGSGVSVKFKPGLLPPVVGSAVVLPKSASLEGGFLGAVTTVAPDGRMTLKAAGISDAFDYYELRVPSFSGDSATAARARTDRDRPARSARAAGRASRSRSVVARQAAARCLGGSAAQSLTYSPSFDLGGYFHGKIDKYNNLGPNLPKGASLDMELTATATAALQLKSSGALKCSLDLEPHIKTISTNPVPLSFYYTPVAEVSAGGAVEVVDVGVTATAGVRMSGSMGISSGASFSGSPIFTASPLTPKVSANATIGTAVGGEVIVGPGAGTKDAGVIAGVGGKLNLFEASFGPVFPLNDARYNACLRADAVAFTRELNLTAKAWLGSWDISRTISHSALQGRTDLPGMPWYLPGGCQDTVEPAKPGQPAPTSPGQSVVGPGVEKIEDSTSGTPDQIGYIEGFVPGSKSWVLSTGRISDAVGTPDTLADTDLGQPGNAALTALAGSDTHDAASYSVTLIPRGSRLNVKYAFASEEYPEWVDRGFNDVMAVYVNGLNCATVPGTNTPVSVNSVNANSYPEYHVDNSSGAVGYATTMDGLTVPLTCSVPVTPGEATTVEIAVADSGDAALDSAVALLDQGIWSD